MHRWNGQKRVQLLRAVELYLPFNAPHNAKAKAWDKVAKDYTTAIEEPNAIDGHSASDKFKALLKQF